MLPAIRVHLAALLLGTSPAIAQYTYTDLYTFQTNGYNEIAFQALAQNGQAVGFGGSGAGPRHALIWSGPGSPQDLTPTDFISSQMDWTSIDGKQQVGRGTPSTAAHDHALLWTGTAASVIDLNPSGFNWSMAFGTNGTQQVGMAASNGDFQAFLWNGTAASAVDLGPPGYTSSASGTNGIQQVGSGSGAATGNQTHALLWSGTAASVVDLHPTALHFDSSIALAVAGTQQVGYGSTGTSQDALLWTGTAASAVDLNPGYDFSEAVATNGMQQVGYGYSGPTNDSHALLWSGSAGSVVDLGALLPAEFKSSLAKSIDDQGNVFGIALDTSGNYHAIEWSSVPEPSTWPIVIVCGLALMRRRQRGPGRRDTASSAVWP